MEFIMILIIAFVAIKLGESYGKPLGYKRAKSMLEMKEIPLDPDEEDRSI